METTPVTWATDTEPVVFDRFEITREDGVLYVNQRNYVREVLQQHCDVQGTC